MYVYNISLCITCNSNDIERVKSSWDRPLKPVRCPNSVLTKYDYLNISCIGIWKIQLTVQSRQIVTYSTDNLQLKMKNFCSSFFGFSRSVMVQFHTNNSLRWIKSCVYWGLVSPFELVCFSTQHTTDWLLHQILFNWAASNLFLCLCSDVVDTQALLLTAQTRHNRGACCVPHACSECI